MVNALCIGFMFIGLFFMLTAALGVLRFPDVYCRIHAASKAATFGFGFMVLGMAFLIGTQTDIMKAMVAVTFQFLTAPIGGHLLARVALARGIKPARDPNGSF